MLFRLSTPALVLVVFGVMIGATLAGVAIGRRLGHRRETLREPLSVMQAALVGFVALLLAFGLSMAVGRYESRRAAVVDEANAIGTTYLRAQTLAEPERTESLDLLVEYTDERIRLSEAVPGSAKYKAASSESVAIQNDLWALAGEALDAAPQDSAPRLYVETLNEMIDMHTTRTAGLANQIPAPVMWLQLGASALALGAVGAYVTMVGRGVLTALVAAVMVALLLLVTFDLDRPRRGFITVPDAALVATRAGMNDPPAAGAGGR